jgi:hypothetical protein
MYRIGLEGHGRLHEQRLIEIALRRARAADAHRAVGKLHRKRFAIGLGVHLHGFDSQVAA